MSMCPSNKFQLYYIKIVCNNKKKKQFCSVFVEYILHALGDLYVFPLHVVVPVTMLFPSCTWPVAASDFHYTEPKTYLYE